MKRQSIDRIIACVLLACLLGLASSPACYVLLFGYLDPANLLDPLVLLGVLPGVAGGGFLLVRFLSAPRDQEDVSRFRGLLWEGIGWLGIVVTVSLFLVPPGRVALDLAGLGSSFVLLAAVIYLPIVLLRDTVLGRRVARLPRAVTLLSLVLLVGTLGVVIALSILVPYHLI